MSRVKNALLRSFAACLLAGAPGLLIAQAPLITINIANRCATCSVSASKILTLGSASGPDSITSLMVTRDSRGRFFGVSGMRAVVFDSTGKYLTHLTRPDTNRQRIRNISAITIGRGDSIIVFGGGALMIVYTPELKLARAQNGENFYLHGEEKVVLRDGAILTSFAMPSSSGYGYPYHLYDAEMNYVRSFGANLSGDRSLASPVSVQPFRAPDERSVWSGAPGQGVFHFQQWGINNPGQTLADVTGITPGTVMTFLGPDSVGRVWFQRSTTAAAPGRVTPTSKLLIDVVDVPSRQITGTVEIEAQGPTQMVRGSTLLATFTPSSPGSRKTIDIWRITVNERQ